MLIDAQTLLSDEQAVTVTAFSSNQYDIGNITPKRNIGRSDLRILITCDEAPTAGGAATVAFDVGQATASDGTGFVAFASVAATAIAGIAAGTVLIDAPLPDTSLRYVMGKYTVATGPLTGGKFSCFIVRGSDHQRYYPDGYTNAF